jgi:hypothetical protein
MDPKGKGMVVNDKEKESFVNDPKDDKPTDSGSGHKRKDGRKKKTRSIKEIVYYDSDESSSSQKDDDNDYERTTDFGVTKCVATCSLSIQVYGR